MTRPPHYLTAQQERAVRAALKRGASRDDAAALIGITRSHLDTRLRDQLRDLRVGQGRRSTADGGDWDLTEEEIQRRADAIRATWSEEEASTRRLNFSGPGEPG